MRTRCFLRSSSNTRGTNGYVEHQINLPPDIWKGMGWELNDTLKVDVIKDGINISLQITKEERPENVKSKNDEAICNKP